MSQIRQNPDGSFSRGYSKAELTLIKSLQAEIEARTSADADLSAEQLTLLNRIKSLEEGRYSVSEIQQLIASNSETLQAQDLRVKKLEDSVIVDAYSKEQVDDYMVAWKVEQVPHTFDVPSNEMFDKSSIDDLRVGYAHYKNGDINEPNDNHIPPNTMVRYTIWAYASKPKTATFTIFYADRCVLVVDNQVKETYVDAGGNFGGTGKVANVTLKEGWTRIQFLIANETQSGGLVVTSDLFDQADYLTCSDYFTGMISGKHILPGTLEDNVFSPNMDLTVHTLHATATDVPGVVIGNVKEKGILQIADGTISKSKDEPFTFSDGIRVQGAIRVTQLMIEEDFMRAGEGMIVRTLKDDYGYTKMYEIVNDLRMKSGGGIGILGNGQDGYTLTNTMKLTVNAEGGLTIKGDAATGYELTNAMVLETYDGLAVEGNPRSGYKLKNTMSLLVSEGLLVEGDAVDGYTVTNAMKLAVSSGLKVSGDAVKGYLVTNDMAMDSLGGIAVTGNPVDGYHLKNTMALKVSKGLSITGSADTEYMVTNAMSIISGGGIDVQGNAVDGYKLTATMALKVKPGLIITGNAATGYELANDLKLRTKGGIEAVGNGVDGYDLTNTMALEVSKGLKIAGTAATKYTITNDMSLLGDGGITISGDAVLGYKVKNALLYETLGGIEVTGTADQKLSFKNTMVLTGGTGVTITGTAATGYKVDTTVAVEVYPGLSVEKLAGTATYKIKNTMALMVGDGLAVTGNAVTGYKIDQDFKLIAGAGTTITGNYKDGFTIASAMAIDTGGGIGITGDPKTGFKIRNEMSLTSTGGISVTGNGYEGYTIKNVMALKSKKANVVITGNAGSATGIELNAADVKAAGGIAVTFNPATATTDPEYIVKNAMTLINGGGVGVSGTADTGYTLKNALALSVLPGLELLGTPDTALVLSNAMKLTAGNSMTVTGNAQDGYVVSNALSVTENGGIDVSGGLVGGYKIRNTMKLLSGGGLTIAGTAYEGYTVTNALELTNGGGLTISGTPATGYTVTNALKLIAGAGVRITGSATLGYTIEATPGGVGVGGGLSITGDDTTGYVITNAMKMTSMGGLIIGGNAANNTTGITIKNNMKLSTTSLIMSVTGNAADGYVIDDKLSFVEGGGVDVAQNTTTGVYTVTNTMKLFAGDGMSVAGSAALGYTVSNAMSLTSLGGISVSGNAQDGYKVKNTMVLKTLSNLIKVTGNAVDGYTLDGDISIVSGGGISIARDAATGEYTVTNALSLVNGNPDGSLAISGNAKTGFTLTGKWPTLSQGTDIKITNTTPGVYKIDANVHVQDVTKKTQDKNFVTVTDSGDGNHQLGISETIFESYVEEIIEANTHVKDVVSDIDFIEVYDSGNKIHRLRIPDFDKMIPWIQKGQAPFVSGSAGGTPSLGPNARLNQNNPQFVQTSSTGYVLAGYFSGWIPANTANALRFVTQGGWTEEASTTDIRISIDVADPNATGGLFNVAFTRSITASLGTDTGDPNQDWYNEMIHTIPFAARDYWRHYEIFCYVRKTAGSGNVNAKFREVWADHTSNPIPARWYKTYGTRTES